MDGADAETRRTQNVKAPSTTPKQTTQPSTSQSKTPSPAVPHLPNPTNGPKAPTGKNSLETRGIKSSASEEREGGRNRTIRHRRTTLVVRVVAVVGGVEGVEEAGLVEE